MSPTIFNTKVWVALSHLEQLEPSCDFHNEVVDVVDLTKGVDAIDVEAYLLESLQRWSKQSLG